MVTTTDQRLLGVPESWIRQTIKLGLRGSPNEYREALEADKCRIGAYAGQILDKTTVSQEVIEVNLVLVTGSQLGFKVPTPRYLIYEAALKYGFQKCPAEVGPALCGQYPDHPRREWFPIGMKPIADSGGRLRVFSVGRYDDRKRLSSDDGNPGVVWPPDSRWVFVLPSK